MVGNIDGTVQYCFNTGSVSGMLEVGGLFGNTGSPALYVAYGIVWAWENGIIGGRISGVFAPQETATRAEVAIIIQRFIETVMKYSAASRK